MKILVSKNRRRYVSEGTEKKLALLALINYLFVELFRVEKLPTKRPLIKSSNVRIGNAKPSRSKER